MLATKNIYMQACYQSKDLHAVTDEERIKLQQHLKKMYLDLEQVCDANGLTFMAAFGTVLGAIRHNGFIPWDDDLDILMPREDYDKLINIFSNDLPAKYKIYAPNSDRGPIYRFAKLVDTSTRVLHIGDVESEKSGIYIDIFPLENAPLNKYKVHLLRYSACALMYIARSVRQYKEVGKEYKTLMCSSWAGKGNYYFRNFIGLLFSWRSVSQWFNSFDALVTQNKKSGYFNIPSGGPHIRNFVPRKIEQYLPVKKMKFDDIEVYVPNDAEQHCVDYYGDWHKIPPVEKRWQHFIKEIKFEE